MVLIFKSFIIFFFLLIPLSKASLSKQIEAYLNDFSQNIGLNGNVLVAQKDEIILIKSFGYRDLSKKTPFKLDDQFCVGSITKQFTAIAILKLVDEGCFALDSMISLLLPDLKDAPWAKKVTVKHLLTHTSGIFEPTPLELKDAPQQFSKSHDVIDYLKDKPSLSTPGKLFFYSNSGYLVLGCLIEEITNMSMEVYMREVFFNPLSMNSTYLRMHHRLSESLKIPRMTIPHIYKDDGSVEALKVDDTVYVDFPFVAGGLVSTVTDLEKWNAALYGGQVLSPNMLSEFGTPYQLGYGLGIYKETFANGQDIYKHGGAVDGYQSLLIYLPYKETTICVLTNVDYPNPHRMEALMDHLSMLVFKYSKN